MKRVFRREVMALVMVFLVLIACTAAVVEPEKYDLLPEGVIGTVTMSVCDMTYQFNIFDVTENGVPAFKYSGIQADASDPDVPELTGRTWIIEYQLDPEADYTLPEESFNFECPIEVVNATVQVALAVKGYWTWDPRNPNLATMGAALVSGDNIIGVATVSVNTFIRDIPWPIVFAQVCAAFQNAKQPRPCTWFAFYLPDGTIVRWHVPYPPPPDDGDWMFKPWPIEPPGGWPC